MKIENCYLDLKKTFELKKKKRGVIIDMYRDMMFTHRDGGVEISKSLYVTLKSSGYLLDLREEKIDQIINGVQDLSN